MPKLTEVCLDRFDPDVYVISVIQKLSGIQKVAGGEVCIAKGRM